MFRNADSRLVALLIALSTGFGGGIVARAQAPTPTPAPSIAAAGARLNSGDADGASQILEQVVAADPTNARAWRMLGAAAKQKKDVDRAIAAWKKALEVDPAMPAPLLNLGLAYAAKGDLDQAFAWLQKARATGRIDMTQMEGTPELASLEKDPRLAPLKATAKDFANPFVEPTKIIREWNGEASNDQFGWIARNIGDVDADGVPDIVTSAPSRDIGGQNAGRVYVYSTKTGKLLWSADGKPGDQFGNGVEGVGDANKDGIPDVVAGAPGGGYAKVFSGRDGKLLWSFEGEDKAKDSFGLHTDGAGDVDQDGHADVIVGAPGNSAAGSNAGRVYVYSGKTGGVLLTLTGERAGDRFGSAVAGSSDKNGALLLVGAPRGGPGKTGRTYIYRGLSSKPAFSIESDESGAALGGMFLAIPGDVDGDGVTDVYASDWNNSAKGPSTGRIYVHSGKDGQRLMTLTGENAGDGFGTSPSVAGDVDGDGHADLIVGAWQYGGAALGAGRAYLYSGKDGRLMRTFTCRTPGDAFGFDAVTMGDIDGDGTSDFLITSAWSGVHGFHSGRIFIVSSGVKAAMKPGASK